MLNTIMNLTRLSILLKLQSGAIFVTSFLMPIVMMIILGLAITAEVPALRVDVANMDVDDAGEPEPQAAELIAALRDVAGDTEAVIICVYGADDNPEACSLAEDARYEDIGTARLEDRDAIAALEIPAGFTEQLRNGDAVSLVYRADQDFNAATVTQNTVITAVDRINSSVRIANAATEVAAEQLGAEDEAGAFAALLSQAQAALEAPPAIVNVDSSAPNVATGTNQSVPGIASMFVFITLMNTASFLVFERERGTLQRLIVMPVRRGVILMGKVLGEYVFAVLQFGLFILLGYFFLGVNFGDDPLGVVGIVLAFCSAGVGLGLLLSTLVRTADQAAGIALMLALTAAPLGGAWWPSELNPDFIQAIGRLAPIAWAMDAFTELQFQQGTLMDILPSLGVMLLMGVVFGGLAVLNFRYE